MTIPLQADRGNGTRPLEVAIVGGGITGLVLAIGLLRRGVAFTIYERAANFGELGVGITATPNAERAMAAMDPRVLQGFLTVATESGDDLLNFVDAFNEKGDDPHASAIDLIHQLKVGDGFRAARRCDLVEQLVQHIPAEHVRYQKYLASIEEPGANGRATLTFRDGTTAEADVVLGCDGIRSTTRPYLFPPASNLPLPDPRYSHQLCYRTIVPLPAAAAVLGPAKSGTAIMHTGPGAFILTLPLARIGLMHVEVFVIDPDPWPTIRSESDAVRYVLPATRDEAAAFFEDFGPTARGIVSLLPERLEKWAVFDMLDAPAETYARGRVAIAGDAAHASTPNHGGGAGVGIEDALVLAELLAAIVERGREVGGGAVEEALRVYDEVRRERSQWLVASSRRLAGIYSWKEGAEATKNSGPELEKRSHQLWDYDIDGMVTKALKLLGERLG